MTFALLQLLACQPDAPADSGTKTATDDTATDTAADTATETGDTALPAPTLQIVLTPETVIAGAPVQLEVTVTDFLFVDPSTMPPPKVEPGEGHYHINLDGEYAGAAWEPSLEIDTITIPVGTHTFTVVLEDSKHNELDPSVSAETTLTIE